MFRAGAPDPVQYSKLYINNRQFTGSQALVAKKRQTQTSAMFQTGKFHVHTHRKNSRRGSSGMDLQSRNASHSSDHVVKIAVWDVWGVVVRIPRCPENST